MSPDELQVAKEVKLVFDEIQKQPQTTIEQPKGKYRPKKQLQRDIETVKPIGLQRDIDTTREDVEKVVLAQQKAQLEINLRAKQEALRFLENQKAQQEAAQKAQRDAVQNIILPIGTVPETALEQPKGKYRPKRSVVLDTIPPPPSGSPRKRPPPSSGNPPRKRVVHYLTPQAEEQTRPPSTIPQPKPKSSPIETRTNIPKASVVRISPDEILVAKEIPEVFNEIQRQPQTAPEQPKGKYRPKRIVVPNTDPTVKTIGLQRDIDTTQSDVEKVLSQQRVLLLAQQEAKLLAQQEAERLLLEQEEARLLAQQEEARLLAKQEARLLAQKEAENKSERDLKRLKALQKVEEVKQAYRDKKEKEKLQKEIDDQRTQLLARQEEERQEAARQEAARKKQKDLDDQLARQEAARKEEERKKQKDLDDQLARQEAERQEAARKEAEQILIDENMGKTIISFKKKRNIVVNPPLPMTHNLSTPPKSTPDPIFITPPPSQEEVITPTSSQETTYSQETTSSEKKKRAPNRPKEEIALEKEEKEKKRIERAEKKEKEEKEKAEKAKAKEEKAKAKEEKAPAKAKPKPPIQGKGLLNHREQTTHRFKVLKGELLAGNTSKLVVNEMRTLVKQLVQMRELTNDQCQLILKELKTL